jgi:hypothetical protein
MLIVTTFAVAGCPGSPPPEPLAPRPKGYAGRMIDADAHSERAEQHREAAKIPEAISARGEGYTCGDTVLADQATSGGERLTPSVPCWDAAEEAAEHQRFLAAREQQRADAERRSAAILVETELAACRGIPARELEHSPFAHRKEIAAVSPEREANVLRGVRIVWKPVPGLTATWLRQAIACHRARFERLGEPATYLPDDPTLVAHATTTVELRDGHLEVLIETTDDLSAQVALGRALELVRPRSASRD